MKRYRYIARDQSGELVKGVIYGQTISQCLQELRGKHLYPIKLTSRYQLTKKITYLELGVFCKQFSTLLKAGIAIPRALKLLSDQNAIPHLQEIILDLLLDLEEGKSLYQGFQEKAKQFPSFFSPLIKAGEMTNSLDQVLEELASYYTAEDRFRKQIKQLLIYPLILLITTGGVVGFLFLKIIPEFAQIYLNLEAEMPLLTNCLLAISQFLRSHFKPILIGFSGCTFYLIYVLKYSALKNWFAKVQYFIPIWGRLQVKLLTGRLARSLSLLLGNGLEVLSAIELTVGTSGVQADIFLQQIATYIKQGQSLAYSLDAIEFFPKIFVEMVNVGEATGFLANMLHRAAEMFEEDCKDQIARFVTIFEPGLLLAIALVVGVIVFAIMLPIFDLLKLF